MQLFINNWSSALAAPATAEAGSLSVSPSDAAALVGLVGGDYYLLTLAARDANGLESGHEVVKVTAAASGALTVQRGQEGTAARAWLEGVVVSARLTKGTLEALRDSSGPTGGDFLTRANFVDQVTNGALGKQSPIGIFARDDVGACIVAPGSNALKAMLPWLTTALMLERVLVGPYEFAGGNRSGISLNADGMVSLNTGTAAAVSSQSSLFASARVSNAAHVAPGSFVMAPIRASALSGGAQRYALSIELYLPPYGVVAFNYGIDASESLWSIRWLDSVGAEQTFLTTRPFSALGLSFPRIEILGSNMVCKEGGVTIHTIPLAALQKNESASMSFGCVVSLYKAVGTAPVLIGLGDPSGQLILNPV